MRGGVMSRTEMRDGGTGRERSCVAMWCPRKPQPPIMRVWPRGVFDGSIVVDG